MRSYVLTHDGSWEDEMVFSTLEGIEQVGEFVAMWPGSVLVATEMRAGALTKLLRAYLPGMRFLIAPLAVDRNGSLPTMLWDFIRNPKDAVSRSAAIRRIAARINKKRLQDGEPILSQKALQDLRRHLEQIRREHRRQRKA